MVQNDTDNHAVRFLHYEVHLMALHRRDVLRPQRRLFSIIVSGRPSAIHVLDERLAAFLSEQRGQRCAMLAYVRATPCRSSFIKAGCESNRPVLRRRLRRSRRRGTCAQHFMMITSVADSQP